jgi:IS30 family transposase
MQLHANASLTIKQRREIKELYDSGQSVKVLAHRYGVHETTIRRWSQRHSPFDRSSAPHTHTRVVTEEYREAVIAYRQAHPYAGPIRIAQALATDYPQAHRGTVLQILQAAGLTRPLRKKEG